MEKTRAADNILCIGSLKSSYINTLFDQGKENMTHLKRFTPLTIGVCAVLGLTACNNDSSGVSSETSSVALVQGNYELVTNLSEPVVFTSYDKSQTSKPLQLTIGYGSGTFHDPKDPINVAYTLSDRGPNIKCKESEKIFGIKDFCGEENNGKFVVDKDGKIFPKPDFDPTIYKVEFKQQGGTLVPTVVEQIPLTDKDGKPIYGLSNDFPDRPEDLTKITSSDKSAPNTEKGYDVDAKRLAFNQNSLDTEDIARLPNGSFWLADEYAPSLVHVSTTGQVLERVVPNDSGINNPITGESMSVCDALKNGTENTTKANYPVTCGLPGILDLRKLNRGIENIAVSPDGKTLYFGMQSPLANPSVSAYKKSRNVRIFTVALKDDGSFDKVTGEYVYVLDTPDTFALGEAGDTGKKQNDVKLSAMTVTPNGKLIQLERISKTTKLYQVDISKATNILGTKWDDRNTQPSLEQHTDLEAAGIVPVTKTLVYNTLSDYPDAMNPGKVEGVTILNNEFFLLVNDNDFGIEGNPTVFNLIKNASGLMR